MAKWKEKNYELALERYTLGVDMLQNLRARGRENEELLAGVTCRLLKNQAACALKLELWGLAARACDKVLHFKPRDVKALRAGRAGSFRTAPPPRPGDPARRRRARRAAAAASRA